MDTTAFADMTAQGPVALKMAGALGASAAESILSSRSHLNAENVAAAIWRVGWSGVSEALGEVMDAARSRGGGDAARTAEELYPLDAADRLAAVAVTEGMDGAAIVTAECVEDDSTLTGRAVVAEVWCCFAGGGWGIVDEIEVDDVDPATAIAEALGTCMPFYADARPPLSAEVPYEVAESALGLTDAAEPDMQALAHALRALIAANPELTGLAEEELAPSAFAVAMAGGVEPGEDVGLDGLMSAATEAAGSKAQGAEGRRAREAGGDVR